MKNSEKKYIQRLSSIVVVLLGLVAMTFFPGCEDDPDLNMSGLDNFFEVHPYISDPRNVKTPVVEINPETAQISRPDDTVVFTVRGGIRPYSWHVVDSTYGSISESGAFQAVYTVKRVFNNQVIVADKDGNSAIASIGTTATDGLTLSPTTATIKDVGESKTFSVTGGEKPYTWTVTDGAAGTVAKTTDNQAAYTVTRVQDNTLIVTDNIGRTATASISASGYTTLSITPSAVTRSTNDVVGVNIQFNADGGAQPLGTWDVSQPALGTIDAAGLYTVVSTVAGENIVSITDADGNRETATVTHQ